jgi:hypothetical protein
MCGGEEDGGCATYFRISSPYPYMGVFIGITEVGRKAILDISPRRSRVVRQLFRSLVRQFREFFAKCAGDGTRDGR